MQSEGKSMHTSEIISLDIVLLGFDARIGKGFQLKEVGRGIEENI